MIIKAILIILLAVVFFGLGTKWKTKRPTERRAGYCEKQHHSNVVVIAEFILTLSAVFLILAAVAL